MREAAEVLELTALLDRRPHALSGGKRQRVALARALAGRPAFEERPLRLRGRDTVVAVALTLVIGATQLRVLRRGRLVV